MGTGKSWLSLEPSALVLSTVKRPEREEAGDLLVRFYETTGRPCSASIFVHGARAAWRSNLAEDPGEPLSCRAGQISLPVQPFEIVTLLISRNP
jgi:alpha-mannosidase